MGISVNGGVWIMEPLEVEFFAEKEEVTIIPNFSENKICLISVSCKKPYQSVLPRSMCSHDVMCWLANTGGLWTLQPLHAHQGATVVGHQPEAEAQV